MDDSFGRMFEEFGASSADNTPEPVQRGCKRPLTETQRKVKNERDKGRRQQHKMEFERLRNVELELNQMAPRFNELQTQAVIRTNTITTLTEENERLKNELENALRERAPSHRKNGARMANLLLHGNQLPPLALLDGEINQMLWNAAVVRPRPPMSDLSIGAAVQTQGIAAMAAEQESVIDKEILTNRFTMKVPYLFVASKTQEVTSIRLRGRCSVNPEGCQVQYFFEWIPHQTNQEPWENLGWSPIDVGLVQNLAPPCQVGRGGAQANFPIKFLLWNSVGALNAYRQRYVVDLINRIQPAVLVLTETRLTRARAEQIIGTFPFDAHRVTPNLGFVGGMWLLWRSGVVEVEVLSFTEQEIHALIKEPQTNRIPFPWGFFKDVNFDSLEESPSNLVPTPNYEQLANSEPVTESQGDAPSQTGSMRYADELVEKFINKLDAMEENEIKFSDFESLKEELDIIGADNILPPSLGPIDERIRRVHGDITSGIPLSACMIRYCYILLCSVIKEMGELKLEQVEEKKMLFWRDAINSGLFIGLRGKFAIDHLKKIARAFYGLKACNDGCNDKRDIENIEQRMSELKIELRSLEEKHAQKTEEQSSEVRKHCIGEAEEFWGKPLSTYLFPPF